MLVVAAWGYTFVVVKAATEVWPTLSFIALRFWIATVAFLPLLAIRRQALASRGRSLRAGFAAGVLMLLGYAFQTAGLARTGVSIAAFITGLSVVLVPIGARLLGHRLTWSAIAGVVVATFGLGVLCFAGPDAASGASSGGGTTRFGLGVGEVMVLLCAVAFSGQILVTDRHARTVDPIWFTASQCLVTAVGATVGALVFEVQPHGLPPADGSVWFAAAFCGVIGSTVAFTVQTVAQRVTPPAHVALIYATEPVFAAVYAYWLRDERLTEPMIVGCALILGGMICSEIGPRLGAALRGWTRPDRAL